MNNAFAGIVSLGDAPIAADRIERLLRAMGRADIAPSRMAGQRAVFIGSSGAVAGRTFVASCRLDNAADVTASLGLSPATEQSECIRAAFETRRNAGIAQLLGAFVFAHWDASSATLTFARDCLGRRALFYCIGDRIVVFATRLSALLAMPEIPRVLDEVRLANFLADNLRDGEATCYRGILRVPSRTVVRLTRAGTATQRYWTPNLDRPRFADEREYVLRARELFDRAVARALKGAPRAAILLSGGLIRARSPRRQRGWLAEIAAATAARLGFAEIACYTGVPPADFSAPAAPGRYLDERGKVEALSRLYPALRQTFVTPRGAHPSQSDPARDFLFIPLPSRNIANLGWFEQIQGRIAADNHAFILHGGRGNLGVSWRGVFCLSVLARQGRFPQLSAEARATAQAAGASMPRVLLREALLPLLPSRAYRALAWARGWPADDIAASSLLRREVVAELDLLKQWRAEGYDPQRRIHGSSVQLRTHFLFDHNQHGRDRGAMYCEANGIDERQPHGDRDLLEFCLAVPETLYRRNGVPRWFARQVFADRLPPEILNETRSGEQAPNWFESLDARKAVIAQEVERMEASPLASRLIDLPRLKRLVADWPQDADEAQIHANEYRYALDRAVHVGQFIRWVEGGNA